MMGYRWTPAAASIWKATIFIMNISSITLAKRHVVYWNSTNARLTEGELTIEVNLNDYLDIYCPHYPAEAPGGAPQAETLALYLIGDKYFQGCTETRGSVKRWECNAPLAPLGPVCFTEKIQRFTPFSLGFEFLPGHHYYYSSLPTDEGPPLPCMKLKVSVCCKPSTEGSKQLQGTPGAPGDDARSLRTAFPPFLLLISLFFQLAI